MTEPTGALPTREELAEIVHANLELAMSEAISHNLNRCGAKDVYFELADAILARLRPAWERLEANQRGADDHAAWVPAADYDLVRRECDELREFTQEMISTLKSPSGVDWRESLKRLAAEATEIDALRAAVAQEEEELRLVMTAAREYVDCCTTFKRDALRGLLDRLAALARPGVRGEL